MLYLRIVASSSTTMLINKKNRYYRYAGELNTMKLSVMPTHWMIVLSEVRLQG